jgi:hypothetical protein
MKLEHHKSTKPDGTPVEWDERVFEEGEQVWIVYGRLVVKCTILKVDDYFRTTGTPGCEHAFLFYDVDEPIGHSLAEYEMYTNPIEAAKACHRDFPETLQLSETQNQNLDEVREGYIHFISRTHGKHMDESYQAMKAALVPKERNKDWFTYNDFIEWWSKAVR